MSDLLKVANSAFEKTALSPATRARYVGKAINDVCDTYGGIKRGINVAMSKNPTAHSVRRLQGIDRARGVGADYTNPKNVSKFILTPEEHAKSEKIVSDTLHPAARRQVKILQQEHWDNIINNVTKER